MTEWAKWYQATINSAAYREMRKAQLVRDEAELALMYGMKP